MHLFTPWSSYLTYPCECQSTGSSFAEGLLHTLVEEGPKALATPDDLAVRYIKRIWMVTKALNGLICAGVPQDWTTHMIGHELTGNLRY
ncbi:hypothetical protein [Photobacterium leiognathi]|uniref:hypothetical protein n=1 Tax=Photobacterium leiognathi TaxID=553611 RepID=UPI003F74E666